MLVIEEELRLVDVREQPFGDGVALSSGLLTDRVCSLTDSRQGQMQHLNLHSAQILPRSILQHQRWVCTLAMGEVLQQRAAIAINADTERVVIRFQNQPPVLTDVGCSLLSWPARLQVQEPALGL